MVHFIAKTWFDVFNLQLESKLLQNSTQKQKKVL